MSAQTLRYSSPTSGDVAAAVGRHRRPESLADLARPRPAMQDPPSPRWVGSTNRITGSTGHRIAVPDEGVIRSARREPRNAPNRRYVASHRAGAGRSAIVGNHRASGAVSIESWLLMGKPRQQVLLASLVAAGLLLAMPSDGRRGTVDAVDAAAQRALGGNAAPHNPGDDRATGGGSAAQPGGRPTEQSDGEQGLPVSSAPTSAPAGKTAPEVVVATSAPHTMTGSGPARSLLTTGTSAVALTFDDGPDPVQTPRILALLDQYHVKAVFCLVGEQVRRHPEVVRQIAEAGHVLCNHTWSHSLTIGKDETAAVHADLVRTNDAIQAAVPGAAIPFFRAPGGNFTKRLVDVAAADGMTSIYWQVDPWDWYMPADETHAEHVARVVADVRRNVRPGSIVLSHDFKQPDTVEAYEKLLPWLTENFTLGIPGEPVPATPPSTAPTPSESPETQQRLATLSPSGGTTPPSVETAAT